MRFFDFIITKDSVLHVEQVCHSVVLTILFFAQQFSTNANLFRILKEKILKVPLGPCLHHPFLTVRNYQVRFPGRIILYTSRTTIRVRDFSVFSNKHIYVMSKKHFMESFVLVHVDDEESESACENDAIERTMISKAIEAISSVINNDVSAVIAAAPAWA